MRFVYEDLKYPTGMDFDVNKMLPFHSVYPLVLDSADSYGYKSIRGTGFIIKLGKNKELFFVTAEHCFNKSKDDERIEIQYVPNKTKLFKNISLGQKLQDNNPDNDVAIFHIPRKTNKPDYKFLQKTAIPLYLNDSNIDDVLSEKGDLRVVGYPLAYETPKDAYKTRIEYNENADVQDQDIIAYHRFFKGSVVKDEEDNIYQLTNIDWDSGDLSGFSGSPVVGFFYHPDKDMEFNFVGSMDHNAYFSATTDNKNIDLVVLGMVITGSESSKIVRFISIEVIVDIIKNNYELFEKAIQI